MFSRAAKAAPRAAAVQWESAEGGLGCIPPASLASVAEPLYARLLAWTPAMPACVSIGKSHSSCAARAAPSLDNIARVLR